MLFCSLNCSNFSNWVLSAVSLSLYYAPSFCFLSTSLLSGFIRDCIPSLYILPGGRIVHFSKEPWFLSSENGIRNQDLGAGRAHWYWVSVPLGPLDGHMHVCSFHCFLLVCYGLFLFHRCLPSPCPPVWFIICFLLASKFGSISWLSFY